MFSNAQQSIPIVFREIMKNDDRCAEIKEQPVVSVSAFAEFKALRADKRNLRQGAMRLLQRLNDPTQQR